MFRNVLIVLFTVVACAVFAAPAEKVREPVFPVGVYLPWELVHQVVKKNGGDYKGKDFWPYTAKLFNELKNKYNCNIVWVVNINFDDAEKLLKIADKDGLKVAVTPPAIVGIRHFRGPKYITRAVRKAVEKLRKYPSLAAYVLIDEARTGEMPHMENIRKEFARLDPSRPAVIVTMPQHPGVCGKYRQCDNLSRRLRFRTPPRSQPAQPGGFVKKLLPPYYRQNLGIRGKNRKSSLGDAPGVPKYLGAVVLR